MRIAVDLRTLLAPFESGVSIYTKAIVRELQKREDCELDLFYQSKNPCEHIHNEFKNARHLPISNSLFHIKSILRFPKLPENYFLQSPDLIWLPDRRPFYRTSIPVVTTVHDAVPENYSHTASLKSRLWHWIFNLKRIERLSDGFIFPTHSVANEISPRLPFEVTYEGVHLEESSTEMELPTDYFLCISSSDPRKRINWVVNVAEKNPDLNFVIAGIKKDDPRFPRMNFTQLTNLYWVSGFTEKEKRTLLENAKCLLALSEYEGFDLPILEAMQVNCPVIMSDIPVHHELYEKGMFVGTEEMLSSALRKELSVPVAKRTYSWEMAAESSLLFFHRVIANKD